MRANERKDGVVQYSNLYSWLFWPTVPLSWSLHLIFYQSAAQWFRKAMNQDVLGHLLVCLLIRTQRYLIYLLCTVCFTCVLCSAHLFARSLTHSQVCGRVNNSMAIFAVFFSVLAHSELVNQFEYKKIHLNSSHFDCKARCA